MCELLIPTKVLPCKMTKLIKQGNKLEEEMNKSRGQETGKGKWV